MKAGRPGIAATSVARRRKAVAGRRPSPTPRPGPDRTVVVLAVVGSLLAAAALTFGLLWFMKEGGGDRQEVLDTAEQYAVDFATYDYRTLDEHRRHLLSFSTDRFAATVKSEVAKFDDILVQNKPVSKATVLRRGLAELDGDRAVVVLFVDQEITNKNLPKPRIDRSRMVMELAEVDGEWLLDGLILE